MKKLPLVLLALLTCVGAASAGTLSPGLQDQIRDMAGSDEIKVLVVMKDQADIESLDWNLHVTRAPLAERHRQVVEALRSTAETSQTALRRELDSAALAGGPVRGYTSYWLINALVVVTTVDGVRQLAAREDVDVIEPNLEVSLIEPVARYHKEPLEDGLDRGLSRAIGITPGVVAVGARRVWEELGITGVGAIVGNMDTGVDGTHPALAARWRGNFAPASECWRDAVGFGDATPVDRHYHGTHVMGTITGLAPNDTIGVAPGALWIADNTINQGTGSAFDNDVITGLQWFADPDGNPNTTDDVPDVIQNSWGVNENFSGYFDCDSRWWTAIDNCEAAGVVLTWSAGNEGPGSTSLRSPADRAASPFNTFSVGSTITSPPYTISSFSSRGPSGCGGPYAMKPEIVAPGSGIYSAEPGGGYQYLDGTSMAGPHIAGVVALMRSANPDLDVTTVKQILMDTAIDLGAAGEDNTYGHGFVDAYEAVLASLTGYGSIEGTITDATTSAPIAGVLVDVAGDPRSTTTNASGFFSLMLPAGTWTLDYSAFGYLPDSQPVTVVEDGLADGSIALDAAPTARVYGTVTAFDSTLVGGATITVLDTPLAPVSSGVDGTYEIYVPTGATYDFRARKDGYGADIHTVAVAAATQLDFLLPELNQEDFESGDFAVWPWSFGGNAPWTIDSTDPYEGAYAAKSGDISHNQTSSMSLTLLLAQPGDMSFYYKVSSESNYDYLRFFIDGVERNSWSGTVGWTQGVYAVTAGDHTFEWRYTKDGSVDAGSDAAWVDLIDFPAIGSPPAPAIQVAPGSLTETLAPEQTSQQIVTVSNVGDAMLNFSAGITVNAPAAHAGDVEAFSLAKGERDERAGRGAVLGQGGPDGWGYSWIDSDAIGGPSYAWIDISEIGTAVTLGDDQLTAPVNIGFPFDFYGTTYADVKICSNGFLTFTSNSFTFTNNSIPNAAEPNALIAPYWDDLNPALAGSIYYYRDLANGRFVVQWDGVAQIASGGGAPQTFQAVLNADGTFLMQYATVSSANTCTVGAESPDGADGLQVAFNAPYLHDGLAVLFTFVPPPDPWAAVSPFGGSVAPAGDADLTVTFNSAGLAVGTYEATLNIYSNDPNDPTVQVPITLDVSGTTDVSVLSQPTAFSLGRAVPNPMGRGTTTIRFDVPGGGAQVDLSVFDVTGRRVRTLVSGVQPAGRHAIVWDGRDASGSRVASGTYFYRLRAADFDATEKVVLVK